MEFKRPFSEDEWLATPQPVRQYIEMLEQSILRLTAAMGELKGRTEKLEERMNRNSQNSSQPPSTDAPFHKPERKKKKVKNKRGDQKGHQGHRQQMLEPTRVLPLKPSNCSCGNKRFENMEAIYTHQQIELPRIVLDVAHYVLHKGSCTRCGKTVSAKLSTDQQSGYGPRMSALVAELSGMQGTSRYGVQQFLNSVLGVPISTGAVQKVIDRVSEAVLPAYEKIGETARSQNVGFIDEISWLKSGKLHWLRVMATATVAFYLVHPKRSREAFNELIRHWQGILVSDNFSVYQNWVNKRQNCIAHYIRKARKLSESGTDPVSVFGEQMLVQLQQLCHFAKAPPSARKWKNFYKRFLLLLMLHDERNDEAGQLARSLASEMDSLWVFLDENGVEPTNNRAERALRFGVIWRKRDVSGAKAIKALDGLSGFCRLRKPVVLKAGHPSLFWWNWFRPISKNSSRIWLGSNSFYF